jgi:hypothetical protein
MKRAGRAEKRALLASARGLLGGLGLLGISLLGCFDASIGDGDFSCGKGGLCPDGFHCASNNRCMRVGGDGGVSDGPVGDAAVLDAPNDGTPDDATTDAPRDASPPDAPPDASPPDACIPATCSSLNWQCGFGPNGCNGTLNCGICNPPSFPCDFANHVCR